MAVRAADYLHTTLSLLKERLQWAVRRDFNVTGRIPFARRKAEEENTGFGHWGLGGGKEREL